MAIVSGTHLGPYEILALVGTGGMGEVYRASDPKLGREVAIKVLPEASGGPKQAMIVLEWFQELKRPIASPSRVAPP